MNSQHAKRSISSFCLLLVGLLWNFTLSAKDGLNETIEAADQPTISFYQCPMHPEEVSDQPGRCAVCGMHLVAQEESETASEPKASVMEMPASPSDQSVQHTHKAATIYQCPMHPEETSDKPGRCSICGMFLQPQEPSADSAAQDTGTRQKDEPSTPQAMVHEHDHDHEPAALYRCPMHPDEASGQPGRCSICGMYLVAAASEQSDSQTSTHAGPEIEQAAAAGATSPTARHEHAMQDVAKEPAHEHQQPTYVCPMHPQIMQTTPGSCAICGMDLVVKKFESDDSDLPPVTLSMSVMQNMGVRSTRVERGGLSKQIRTQGRVAYDDDRIIRVHPRTAGWIENLYVRTDGVRIERKDDLADYFSPDVLWAQQDYISALQDTEADSFGDTGSTDPARAFRERSGVDLLKYFKVPSMDIMSLERSMQPRSIIPIKAPQGGILIEHNVREGAFVTPADNIFTIADLSEVWIIVDIFEHQLAWVRSGLSAEVSTPAYPGRNWKGELDFVYPEVDPKARTMRARLEVKNPGELLLPNMFVQIDLITDTDKQEVLMVPREAVILTGEREVVIKDLGEGRFQPVEVTTGLWNDTHAEILSGLDEGDEVVISGQFLIDSESSLQASFRRLGE
jgi:Cu(I)/Ag(I) efflux system membrane fusion protein